MLYLRNDGESYTKYYMAAKAQSEIPTCSVVLTVHTHTSLGMTRVWVSITLAWYTRDIWSSIWRDTRVSAGTLFTELTIVLWRAWTSLHIWSIFFSTFPES